MTQLVKTALSLVQSNDPTAFDKLFENASEAEQQEILMAVTSPDLFDCDKEI